MAKEDTFMSSGETEDLDITDNNTQNPVSSEEDLDQTKEVQDQDPPKEDQDPPKEDLDQTKDVQDQDPPKENKDPGDWASLREKVAGGDEKILNRLSRYSTLEDALKAGVEAQNKIGSLKAPKPPGKDASPEEIASYRKQLGIPESPDKYDISLPEGLVLGENDKPVADEFLKVAHEYNVPPEAANAIIARQLELQDQAMQQQEEADDTDKQTARDFLTSDEGWGSEAKLNVNLIHNMLATAPEPVKDGLMNARLPDGTLVGNSPDALRFLANVAREVNPHGTVAPVSGANTVDSVRDQMKELESMMGDHNSEYWKGPKAKENQDKYRALAGRLAVLDRNN